jgi:hypothetical protein
MQDYKMHDNAWRHNDAKKKIKKQF